MELNGRWAGIASPILTLRGGPMVRQKPSMLLVTAVAGVVLFLSACGKGVSSSSSSTTTTPTPETPTSPVPTVSLSVSPQSIVSGQSATLTWSSTDATSVTITPSVPPQGPSGTFQTPALTATTIYTATATGSGGTSTPVSVTLTVTAPPPPPRHLLRPRWQFTHISTTTLARARTYRKRFSRQPTSRPRPLESCSL